METLFKASAVCILLAVSHRLLTFCDVQRCCTVSGTVQGFIFQYPVLLPCICFFLLPSVCCPLNRKLFSYTDKETLNREEDTFFLSLSLTSLHGCFSLSPPFPACCQVHRAKIKCAEACCCCCHFAVGCTGISSSKRNCSDVFQVLYNARAVHMS